MASKLLEIPKKYSNAVLNIALDTIEKKKQAIVFVNTKRGAESEAEKISQKISGTDLQELSNQILGALARPTKQCQRLALCVRKGIAFHHAGLNAKQRELIEDNFRKGTIKIICATPTLAQGVDLPAFRTLIRDLSRFGRRGMAPIPVLEYEQQAGRAGRPGMEEYGEAICIAKSKSNKQSIVETYVFGQPEEILSKLAVEPVLRTYILSLIASEFVGNMQELYDFFDRTFYAHQFKDTTKLHTTIDKMINLLKDWQFVYTSDEKGISSLTSMEADFVSADRIINMKEPEHVRLKATLLGKRVSELYLDPYTANYIITCFRRGMDHRSRTIINEKSHILMICRTLELRPYLSVRTSEWEELEEKSIEWQGFALEKEPIEFTEDYEYYMMSLKTALFFDEWISEKNEEYLLEKYNIRPGEVTAKIDIADWLLYSSHELAKLIKMHSLLVGLTKLRTRLKYGVKEELLALLKLKDIGKVRARKLFNSNIKTLHDVKEADFAKLKLILGEKTALNIKKQVGNESILVDEKTAKKYRKDSRLTDLGGF